jgi:pyridoxal phosphate enzyme (YggS family)
MLPTPEAIAQRLQQLETAILKACEKAQRRREEITLVGVSKTKPLEALRAAYQAGLREFGENYIQEWREKAEAFAQEAPDLHWHIIGALQRNKCKYIAGRAALIHTVDQASLLEELARRLPQGSTQAVLLQCNPDQEGQKAGLRSLDEARHLLNTCPPSIRIQGLMIIPPHHDDPEASRSSFQILRAWRDTLQEERGQMLPHLSMGMSHDFPIAIEEGATLIRVGTAIFGEREHA